jgi:hypothetical protein
MDQTKNSDEEVIRENTEYVLGMYDLYNHDRDIVDALYKKGLSTQVIAAVLNRVKIPAYQKRIRQAKRIITVAGTLSALFILIYLLVITNTDARNFNRPEEREQMFRYIFIIHREIFYWIGTMCILVFVSGLLSYRYYTKLLKDNSDIDF